MDPIAVELGAWTWIFEEGEYFGITGFNFIVWFFILIAYLVPYGLRWNIEIKYPQILSINEVDKLHSINRKIYTIFGIVPTAVFILIIVGLISRLPFLYNLPLILLVIWAIFIVTISTGVVVWKHKNLQRRKWFDLIPPSILLSISYTYFFYGFLISRVDLGILIAITSIPLLLTFIFTLL